MISSFSFMSYTIQISFYFCLEVERSAAVASSAQLSAAQSADRPAEPPRCLSVVSEFARCSHSRASCLCSSSSSRVYIRMHELQSHERTSRLRRVRQGRQAVAEQPRPLQLTPALPSFTHLFLSALQPHPRHHASSAGQRHEYRRWRRLSGSGGQSLASAAAALHQSAAPAGPRSE